MSDLTLESLAQRLEVLEREFARLATVAPKKDWRKVVGLFEGSEFMRQVIAEGQAIRQADRDEARRDINP
jgi:hypothetical protein